MDFLEQVSSIQYLVNTSKSKDDAMNRYAGMEGIQISKESADEVFNKALESKFSEKKVDKKTPQKIEGEKIVASILDYKK